MPLYEFKCNKCGEELERLLSFAERDEPGPCPECGKKGLERQLSNFAKGSSKSKSSACSNAASCSAARGGG